MDVTALRERAVEAGQQIDLVFNDSKQRPIRLGPVEVTLSFDPSPSWAARVTYKVARRGNSQEFKGSSAATPEEAYATLVTELHAYAVSNDL